MASPPTPSPTGANSDEAAIRRARVDFAGVHRIVASIDGWTLDERGSQNGAFFCGNCAYFGYEGIVTEAGEGERMAEAPSEKRVLFLANHGVLVVGDTIAKTIRWHYQLERACMNEMLALQAGRKIHPIPVEATRYNASLSVSAVGARPATWTA